METKILPVLDLKVDDAESGVFEAYASVFGVRDSYNDVVQYGAFRKTLKERGAVKVFYGHDITQPPIGKTMELREVQRGSLPADILTRWPEATGALYARVKLSDTSLGRDVLTLLKDGALNEMSFGYDAVKADYGDDPANGGRVRNLKEVRLHEVSVVAFPANQAALVTSVKAETWAEMGYTTDEINALLGAEMDADAERAALDAVLARLDSRRKALTPRAPVTVAALRLRALALLAEG